MYLVFARKYRPQRFEEVVGQEHITRTLQNAVKMDRVAQAYLFCGSRGVGKTTVARILAKALNCKEGPTAEPCGRCESCRRIATGDDLDVLEIDGASNRGIDEVRALRQNVRLAPARSRFKVYYIDEVHMLTEPAFNALLKTLEEPPQHVKFIFSTTDPQQLPETVRSRCQRFDFRRIPDAGIVRLLEDVCKSEGIKLGRDATAAVARAARGSMRDALGTLDQLAALGAPAGTGAEVGMDEVLAVLGAVGRQVLGQIVDAVAQEDAAAALRAAHTVLFGGTAPEDFADQLGEYLRDLMVASYCGADDPLLAGAVADSETLRRQSGLFSPDQLMYMIQLLREAKVRARRDTTGRVALELAVIKMCRLSDLVSVQEALGELSGAARSAPPSRGPLPGVARPAAGRSAPPSREASGGESAPVGPLRLKEKLKSRTERGNGPPPTPQRKAPDGMDEVKYRQVLASAESPEVGRQAVRQERLLKAFAEGDKELHLNPVRLERLGGQPEPAEQPPEEEPGEESAEEEAE
jgi:DNA polymerase-3 subunit gamma/tau